MRHHLKLLTVLATISFSSSVAYATGSESFNFMDAVIDSLARVKESRDTRLQDPEKASLVDLMKNIRENIYKLESAKQIIAPFANSEKELISKPAEFLELVYEYAIELDKKSIDHLEKMGNMSQNELVAGKGTLAKESSQIMADADDTWKTLVQATANATAALVTFDEKGLGTNRLNISIEEKASLSKKLLLLFGDEIKVGVQAGQHPAAAAPAALWQFLNLQNLKASDEV